MIRVANSSDLEKMRAELEQEPYGRAILAAVEAYGFDEKFQTVYIDMQEDECRAVYLYLHRSLLLYSSKNQIDIDFIEQMAGFAVPELVAGRQDSVNVVSWLLTEHTMEQAQQMPQIMDAQGHPVECFAAAGDTGSDWAVLRVQG